MRPKWAVSVAVVLAAGLALAWVAKPPIGIATARGDFQVDRASVSGNATVLEGSLVDAGFYGSKLRLYGGNEMFLGSDSRGQVFRDHLVLERGVARIGTSKGYTVDAAGLRVLAAANSTADVNLPGAGRVEVTAVSGAARVTNGTGVLLAQVLPGRALAFTMQASGAAPPEKLTGVLSQSNGHYFLTDTTAGVTVELAGSDLSKLAGKVVEVTGTLDVNAQAAESAAHVVDVISVRVVGAAAKAAAAASTGAKVGSALSSHAVIVAGVAVAAVAVPAAIALTSGEQPSGTPTPSPTPPPTSRPTPIPSPRPAPRPIISR